MVVKLTGPALGCLLLSGCVTPLNYAVYAPRVYKLSVYIHDEAKCRVYAAAYKPGLSISKIGTQGLSAGIGSAPSAAISPLAVGISAASAAGSETVSELGLTTTAQIKVLIDCLKQLTEHDHSALVLDPNG